MDIYADEMTTHSALNSFELIVIMRIKLILHTLYYDILNIEYNFFLGVEQCVSMVISSLSGFR